MQIAFLVCVAAWVHVFGRCLFSRYKVFIPKWCVAASQLPFSPFLCSRYRFFLVKWCVTEAVGAVVESVLGVSTWSRYMEPIVESVR
jgi:hypothetical protein